LQTFLPFSSFEKSAEVLDYRRLGKQRVECLQLLAVGIKLRDKDKVPWMNHPARLMWVGHEHQLAKYGLVMCTQWINLGYKDTCYDKIKAYLDLYPETSLPSWLGDEKIHSSHRAALLHKDFSFYKKYNWTESPIQEYVWPVQINKKE